MRVNIEDKTWVDTRIHRLAKSLNVPVFFAVGVCAYLWHVAQANASAEFFSDVIDDLTVIQGLANLLVKYDLCEVLDNGKFRLKGMTERIRELESLKKKRKESGRLGGIKKSSKPLASARTTPVANASDESCLSGLVLSGTGLVLSGLVSEEKNNGKGIEEKRVTPSLSQGVSVMIDAPKKSIKFKEGESWQNDLAVEWRRWASAQRPHLADKFNFPKFVDAIVRLTDHLEFNENQMNGLFDWIRNNPFWSTNALSPVSLLSFSKNGLRKVDNVISSMQKEYYDKKKIKDVEKIDIIEQRIREGKSPF